MKPKIIIAFITLAAAFLSSISFGDTCAPNDNTCKQIQYLRESGVKPTKVTNISDVTSSNKTTETTTSEPQPFVIPPPPYSHKPTDTNTDGANKTNDKQPTDTSVNQPEQKKKFVFQLPTFPLQYQKDKQKQPVGAIRYQ